MAEAPLDLYIAVYDDATSAEADYDVLKGLAKGGLVKLTAYMLVSRDADGKIHVKDSDHRGRAGAGVGAVIGLVAAAIFPPSLLAGAVAGGLVGGGVGSLFSRKDRKEIKADLENDMPPNSSAIIVVFEEIWVEKVEKALEKAAKRQLKELDEESEKAIEEAAA